LSDNGEVLRLLKSILAGLLAVVLSIVLMLVDAFITVRIRSGNPTGVGRLAIRIGYGTLLTGLAIFVVAAFWQYQRGRRDD
jgi:hypothetical protein